MLSEDDLDGFPDNVSDDFDDFLVPIYDEATTGPDGYAAPTSIEPESDALDAPENPRDESRLYEYSKITKPNHFRILVLKARNGSHDTVHCELCEEDLTSDSCPEFEALSYTWGSTAELFKIWIDGKILRVTENLRDALLCLSSDGKDRLLWVDAICINQMSSSSDAARTEQKSAKFGHIQGDLDEKTTQVQQMGEIYAKAKSMVIWLGPSLIENDQLFEFLGEYQRESDPLKYLKKRQQLWTLSGRIAEVIESLLSLLRHNWFRRVWIVQEVARSRKAEVRRGDHAVSTAVFTQLPGLLDLKPDHHCQQILDIMPGSRSLNLHWPEGRDAGGSWVRKDLRTLLQNFRDCESSQPGDKIYALLGLSIEGMRKERKLALDYTKTGSRIVRDTIITLLPTCGHKRLPAWTLEQFWSNLDSLENAVLMWAVTSNVECLERLRSFTPECPFEASPNWRRRAYYNREMANATTGIVRQLMEKKVVSIDGPSPDGDKILMWVASEGHDDILEVLLDKMESGLHATFQSQQIQAALNTAILHNMTGVVRLLIEREIYIHGPSSDGDELLMWVASKGHVDILEMLLEKMEKGIYATFRSQKVQAALNTAIACNKANVARVLVDKRKVDVLKPGAERDKLLMLVASEGYDDILKMLLIEVEKGDHAPLPSHQLQAAFFAAIRSKRGSVVEVLLENRGFDVNGHNEKGEVPLVIALQAENDEAIIALLRADGIDTSDEVLRQQLLDWCTELTPWAEISFHVAFTTLKDANLDTADLTEYAGKSLLKRAVIKGDSTAVELLLNIEGIAVDWKDAHGRTPWSYAMAPGRSQIAKILLETKKIDVDSRDLKGRTPMSYAAELARSNTVRLLLGLNEVEVDSRDMIGRTPLSYAATNGDTDVLKLLLETYKVEVDSRDQAGRTPLSYAAEAAQLGVVEILLSTNNTTVDSKDERGCTPLSWAVKSKDWRFIHVVQYLIDVGKADPNIADHNNTTPLIWADRMLGLDLGASPLF